MDFTSRRIYRAEIFFKSRTTATDTLSDGDSVGECLHLELGSCQLDICKIRSDVGESVDNVLASDNESGERRSQRDFGGVPWRGVSRFCAAV